MFCVGSKTCHPELKRSCLNISRRDESIGACLAVDGMVVYTNVLNFGEIEKKIGKITHFGNFRVLGKS